LQSSAILNSSSTLNSYNIWFFFNKKFIVLLQIINKC
jgi:hypothetical protein